MDIVRIPHKPYSLVLKALGLRYVYIMIISKYLAADKITTSEI